MNKTKYVFRVLLTISILMSIVTPFHIEAKEEYDNSEIEIYNKRLQLFKNMEVIYQIPWYYIAAIDQFERNIQPISRKKETKDHLIAIYFSKEKWAGLLHPDPGDQNPGRISFFNGLGLDGDGDGKADRNNDLDVLVAFLTHLSRYGFSEHDLANGLTEYYNETSADIISEIATIYKTFGTLNLDQRVFPMPKRYNYSYRSTWGDSRGWGGLRIHEGTDIFANYHTPVRSAGPGYVEVLGWNRYGGWRVGIRGVNNVYYYYAHLSSFKKGLKEGDVVNAGDLIGYVGSSGYGPPGTQGKFPPHLHFGLYKYNGKHEWAFDPTPYLRIWERKSKN